MDQRIDFLIKYGIHNFVKHTQKNNTNYFSIKKTTHHKMAQHAEKLIFGIFGDTAKVRYE